MSTTILQTGGRVFQKFVATVTEHLSKPTSKFIRDLLCGILFSDDLVLTNLASKRHFIIRQRGDRTVVLANGAHIILSGLVEHLFAQTHSWLVYTRLHLPNVNKLLYVVAWQGPGYDEPVILLSDMVAENYELALRIRSRYARRWDCETSIQFLKSRMGLERFAVRRYSSMQRLVFLASLAMGFLSFLQWRCKNIRERTNDHLRYCREPKGFWFYRLVIALNDAFCRRGTMSLSAWCRPP